MEIEKMVSQLRKLSPHQVKIIEMMCDHKNPKFIHEIANYSNNEITYTLTNGQDDFFDIRPQTMNKLKKLDFLKNESLPGTYFIIRTKYFIHENNKVMVFNILGQLKIQRNAKRKRVNTNS